MHRHDEAAPPHIPQLDLTRRPDARARTGGRTVTIKLRMDEELHQALRLLAALARDDYAKLQAQYDDYVFNGYDNPRTSDPPPVVLHRADIGISSVVRALVADACRNPAASIKRITELHRLQAD